MPLLRLLLAAALVAPAALAQTTFTVTTTDDAGPGSLRQAIVDANAAANAGGPDVIEFALPGAGPFRIEPQSELPAILEAVVIDGLSQPGADCASWPATLLVELDGRRAGLDSDGLVFEGGGGSTVRGLVVNRFGDDGVDVEGAGGNAFRCNYVGTDVTGLDAKPNGSDGFILESPDNVVGGPSPSDRNLISGNGEDGVDVDAFDVPAERNVIQGNYIGVAADGVSPLGNDDDGVETQHGALDTLVGGTGAGDGNVIAYNGDNGVQVEHDATLRTSVLGNAIFGNGELPIDLGASGRTLNDAGDDDDGPNGLQNFPELSRAETAANTGVTTVEGVLESAPGATFRVELFAEGTGPSGDGQAFLEALEVTTDGDGEAAFSVDLAAALDDGLRVSATATDADGNTSELSRSIRVGVLNNVAGERAPGAGLEVVVAPNPAVGAASVRLALPEAAAVEVALVDALGRTVRRGLEALGAGEHALDLDVAGLPAGVYVVVVRAGGAVRASTLTLAR